MITKARYIRISSSTQSTARQLVKQHPEEQVFIDVISGSIPFKERPEGKRLLDSIANGSINYLSTSSVDRLGRNSFDCQSTLNWLGEQGVTVKIDNLGIESMVNGKPNPIFKMICDVLSNVASMELEAIRERQAQGIAIYKAKNEVLRQQGITLKRNKPSASDVDVLKKYDKVLKELKIGNNSLRKIAVLGGVSLATVQKVKAAYDRQNEKGNN